MHIPLLGTAKERTIGGQELETVGGALGAAAEGGASACNTAAAQRWEPLLSSASLVCRPLLTGKSSNKGKEACPKSAMQEHGRGQGRDPLTSDDGVVSISGCYFLPQMLEVVVMPGKVRLHLVLREDGLDGSDDVRVVACTCTHKCKLQ